jgi:hypothetical protein
MVRDGPRFSEYGVKGTEQLKKRGEKRRGEVCMLMH